MSIEPHLLEDERVLDHCSTKYWAWVCTDKRLLRYRSGSGGAEQLHDISYDEISSVSFVNTGRNNMLGGYGVFAVVLSILFAIGAIGTGEMLVMIISLPLLAIGAYYIYRWLNSETSYFDFNGSGMLRNDNEWRIDEASADDTEDIRDFVRTVRGQL